ncbi:MAG: response regulator [Myxococcales bacterium]|nr:response regulator [Myxococcales bacterium]
MKDRRPLDGAAGSTPGRILVVDDDALLREVFHAILITVSHQVILATDVDGAIEQLVHREIELIVSDVSMPGRSGLDLLCLLREANLDLPFILVTGAPTPEGSAMAVQFDAADYLSKPLSSDALRAAVALGLRLHRMGVPFGHNRAPL